MKVIVNSIVDLPPRERRDKQSQDNCFSPRSILSTFNPNHNHTGAPPSPSSSCKTWGGPPPCTSPTAGRSGTWTASRPRGRHHPGSRQRPWRAALRTRTRGGSAQANPPPSSRCSRPSESPPCEWPPGFPAPWGGRG